MKRAYNLKTDFVKTNNFAVDQVASCILWHRERGIAIRQIDLKPAAYELFRRWVQGQMGKDYNPEQKFEFDKVKIELGSVFQTKDVLPQLITKGEA